MLGQRLTELRRKKKLSQEKAAEKLSIPRSTLSNYEAGNRSPDNETLKKFAEFYNVTTDYLLGITDERNATNKKEDEFSPSENLYNRVIQEAEAEFKVNLRDDPVVEGAVRELIRRLAQMKQK